MQRLLIALAVLTIASPAAAAEEKSQAAGQYIDVSPVALPIVVKGRLLNYIFVSVRLNLGPTVDSVALRTKEPYFRDALVRAAYRTPFTDPKSYVRIDASALKAAMMQEAARIVGPRRVTSVEITNSTPQRVVGVPRPPA
jgi:hypothetical protein